MPNESNSIFKILFFVGLILFMASIMTTPWVYVGQPLPANSTWGRMSTQIEGFPQFIGPNNAGQLQHLFVAGDFWPNTNFTGIGWKVVNNVGNSAIGACANGTYPADKADYYGCLTTMDSSASYVKVSTNSSTKASMVVNISSPASASDNLVLSVTAQIQCHQEWGPVLPLNVSLDVGNAPTRTLILTTVNPGTVCPTQSWSVVTYTWDLTGDNLTVGTFATAYLHIQAMDPSQTIDVSYAEVQIVPSNTKLCGTGLDGIACSLYNFAWTVINFFVMIGTGIVFVFQVLFWFVTMVGIFFGAIPTLFGFGNAPPIIAAPVGILILGMLFYVGLVFMGKIRGTGNTG